MCVLNDTLEIIEADGSVSEMPLCPKEKSGVEQLKKEDSPFEEIEFVRVCGDGGVVVCDEFNNLRKYSKEGEFIWKIEVEISNSDTTAAKCLKVVALLFKNDLNRDRVVGKVSELKHFFIDCATFNI